MKFPLLVLIVLVAGGDLLAAENLPVKPPGSAAESSSKSKVVEQRTLSLMPAIKKGGFRMDDFVLWCPSVIKVGDTYHLFASRWPAEFGLGGWTSYSECVRA